MRLKFLILLVLPALLLAEDKVYILVDNHLGFDGKSLVLSIFDRWSESINSDLDAKKSSEMSNTKFSVYMLGENGITARQSFRFPINPPLDFRKNITPGDRRRHADSLSTLRSEVSSLIDNCPRPPIVDITKGINAISLESYRDGDTRAIWVVSDYQKLPKEYEPIRISEFEETGIPTRLYFTNVENWRKLINSDLRWDKNPEEVLEALRCYSPGEFR